MLSRTDRWPSPRDDRWWVVYACSHQVEELTGVAGISSGPFEKDMSSDPDYPSAMPTTTGIRNQLRTLTKRHRGEPAGEVAAHAADLAGKIGDLESDVATLKSEVARLSH